MVAGSIIMRHTMAPAMVLQQRGAMDQLESWLTDYPDDVVEEILIRLPPKPLGLFRLVSRGWKSNIAHPKFIEKHLTVTVNKAKSLSDYYKNDNINRMKGFCNGIFYSVDPVHNTGISLLNTTTKKYKHLPPVLNDDCFVICAYHLAFPTSQKNDLKFLVFGHSIENEVLSEKLGAQVYTLSTNSWSWVELQVDSLDIRSVGPINRIAPSPYLFYNGALHFIATTSLGYKFILYFDIDDEKLPFREIKLPRNYSNGLTIKFEKLVVFKGSLALIAFGQDEVCRIWVMSEYDRVDSSETPTFSVPLSGVEDFLGCTGSGELMIKKTGNRVFLFDPENQNVKDLGIQDLTPVNGLSPLLFTANLIESLVLLNEKTIKWPSFEIDRMRKNKTNLGSRN